MNNGTGSRFKKREMIATDLDRELSIDDQKLNEELQDQPLYYKKWSEMSAGVAKKAKMAKLFLEEKEAELYVYYSNDGTGKKVKEVESAIALDAEIRRLKRDLIEAEEVSEKFQGIVRAFHQRHEMLKDLTANKRRELVD